jgi:hypothetical protein
MRLVAQARTGSHSARGTSNSDAAADGRAVDGMASSVTPSRTWTECMSCCLFVGLRQSRQTRIPAIFEDGNRRLRLDWLILRHGLRRGIREILFASGSRGFGRLCTLPGTRRHLRWRLRQLEPILCPKRQSLFQCSLSRSGDLRRCRARTLDSRLARCSLGRSCNHRRCRARTLDSRLARCSLGRSCNSRRWRARTLDSRLAH